MTLLFQLSGKDSTGKTLCRKPGLLESGILAVVTFADNFLILATFHIFANNFHIFGSKSVIDVDKHMTFAGCLRNISK